MNAISATLLTSAVRYVALFVLAATSLYADTVTTADNLSVYGIIKEVTPTSITLEGRFNLGTKAYTIPRDKVTRIDLNSTIFNPGAPPRTLGLGPGSDKNVSPPPAPQEDTIVLRGNIQHPCNLMAIDASAVHCAGVDYPRSRALYVLLGTSQ